MDKNTGKYEFFVIHYDMTKLNEIVFQILKFINQWMIKKIKLENYCFNVRNFIESENCNKLITKSEKKTN